MVLMSRLPLQRPVTAGPGSSTGPGGGATGGAGGTSAAAGGGGGGTTTGPSTSGGRGSKPGVESALADRKATSEDLSLLIEYFDKLDAGSESDSDPLDPVGCGMCLCARLRVRMPGLWSVPG
jgi:hypothetical protein